MDPITSPPKDGPSQGKGTPKEQKAFKDLKSLKVKKPVKSEKEDFEALFKQLAAMEINTTVGFLISGFQNLQHKSLSLVVMSYERLVSICFPLRSSTISTNTRMFIIIVFCWVLTFSYFIVVLMFIARLSFCRPVPLIKSYFCDHGPVFKEACSSYSANWTIASVYTVTFIFLPFALIIISYVCIIVALSRIASAQGRWKAFKTCTAHLALVVIFFIPVLVTYMIVWTNLPVDTDSRILNTSLAATLPPLLNPIIYTLKTEEVMEQIKNFLRKQKPAPVIV
ncbi:olfactory receptor 1E16-like [Lepisosteus oculatus]|uniref:olfactory receptor 1E16-like n=1 Tax=Lepisosteus oculatus TaxID=7918 RepID=UPI00371941BE